MEKISILLFLIIKVSFCCDDPSQISLLPPFQEARNIQSKLGDDLNIICCHPDGADSLSWQDKFRNEIVFKNSDGLFSLKDDKGRLILRIDNIDESKMGEYTCTNSKRGQSKSITISAKTASLIPEIIKKNLLFPSNKPIDIKCPITSKQAFKSWQFTRGGKNVVITKPGGDEAFEVSPDKSVFTVKTGSKNANIQLVWCQFQEVSVNGDLKTSLYEFSWTIYDPIDVKLVVDHKGPILESNDVRLICYFQYNEMLSIDLPSNRIAMSNMKLNNKNLKKGKVVLTINKITKESDGQYECKVTKFINIELMEIVEEIARVNIDVVVLPKIISNDFVTSSAKLNDDAYLSCQIVSKQLNQEDVYFEHYSPISSQWIRLYENEEKYNVKLTKASINILTLLMKKVSWDDRGKYKCVAKNAAGEDTKIGLFRVEKSPELTSSATMIHLATKPVRINCSVSGYPVSPSEDIIELKVLNISSSLALNIIDKQPDDINGYSVTYEVINQGELTAGISYKLECYFKSMRTNSVQRKEIELRVAQKPNLPTVDVICSGSSGIVFMYEVLSTEDESSKMVKHVLTYAPSEDFNNNKTNKPLKVIPVKEDAKNGNLTYVLKDLVASRMYTFKWESFNRFGLSNERILSYSTKYLMPTQKPKMLEFSPKGNMINANVTWQDDCPYAGSNSPIIDIVVTMKPLIKQDGKNNNWQWTERNFTLESDKSSAQFLIYLDNPQIDYEIQVALRSHQGTSESLTGIYTANTVLSGSLFSCFPRCAGSMLISSLSLVQSTLVVLFQFLVLRWAQ